MSGGEPFDEFLKQVCPPRELDWRKYRRASRRKVLERVRELGLRGLREYARYLDHHPEEADLLPCLLRVTLSRFFREKEVWHSLERHILPALLNSSRASRPLQVLSIGCCNGQEPYSMALLWKSAIQPYFQDARLEISALDVDFECLDRARAGLYSFKTLREVPQHILNAWFHRESSGFYRLDSEVKQMVSFAQSDLLQNNLPANQDLVFCRYLVFTYFQGRRRLESAHRIISSLNPGGLLVLGRKESLELGPENGLIPVPGLPCFYIRPEELY